MWAGLQDEYKYVLWLTISVYYLHQVILDLGHVTFGNVSDWSADKNSPEEESGIASIDEDDDGKALVL